MIYITYNELFKQEVKHEHSRIVSRITELIAKKIQLPNNEIVLLKSASIPHDFGKNYVCQSILLKPSKLTDHEYRIIQSHVLAGSNHILRTIKALLASYIVSLQHHERIDGKGYANVTNIHKYAKIVAVADVFDALLAKRAYKKAWPPDEAVSYMLENANKQFEAEYVTALLECLDEILNLYHSDGKIKLAR